MAHSAGEEWRHDVSSQRHDCNCGEKLDLADHTFGEWMVTKEPTSTTEGEETRSCSCGKTETRKIPRLSNPFTDVSSDHYYYEPVLWAVNKGITFGVYADRFCLSQDCIREQIVTSMYKAVH